jgi:hypothetical protein
MSAFFGWLKWLFITTRRCDHDEGEWRMINMGMGKIRRCNKCGKCLQII